MPRFVERAAFDTNLFQFSVGRIDLEGKDINDLNSKYPTLMDVLRQANTSGYKLVYLIAPSQSLSSEHDTLESYDFPGIVVDLKTTYHLKLSSLDMSNLCKRAFMSQSFKIRKVPKDYIATRTLLDLAITSGSYSRFKVDEKIPVHGYHGMFEAWMKNSLNGSVADEVFVAYDNSNQEEVGFVTVKCKNNNVNIGLLAVSEKSRRLGIASALLSRVALWALEQIGSNEDATMSVVTQGKNAPACRCYEGFGFTKFSVQQINHVWLPNDLDQPSRTDQDPIPFCRQHFTGREKDSIAHLLSTSIDSASQYTFMCAAKIQNLLGKRSSRVLMVPSGTAALELAALLCDIQPGDEVILPSYTFSSTANAFVLRGAIPVFVDVHEDTLNINETLIEAAISEKTKAICVVHYGGVACEMDYICELAGKYQLKTIEDAAQAYLSYYKGQLLGTIGDFGCFSFHYTKNVICGEGGALSVNNSENLAKRALVMWEKGTNRYDFISGKIDKYEWIDIGSSFVPNELSCAILWSQLEDAEQIIKRRRMLYERYAHNLHSLVDSRKIKIGKTHANIEGNAHIFFVLFPDEETRIYYEKGLKNHGISAFTHYVPLHSSPAGIKYGKVGSDMRITDQIHKTLLRLPIWTDLTFDQIDQICETLQLLANGARCFL